MVFCIAAIAAPAMAQIATPGEMSDRLSAGQVLLAVPWTLDGLPRGEIDIVLVSATGAFAVDAPPLLELLTPMLRREVFDGLIANRDANGDLSLAALAAAGLTATFDRAALRLDVAVPGGLRKPRELAFGAVPPTVSEILPSARRSAFLNVNARDGFTQVDGDGTRDGIVLSLDGAVNVDGTALVGDGTWSEERAIPWQRGAVRAVRDLPDRRLRLTAGDLSFGTAGFQSSLAMGGVSVARNLALQPYRTVRPSGETEFLLDAPATVDFIVNGRLLRTLRLEPGPYTARSFPFLDGVNSLRVEIHEDSGRDRVLDLPVAFDSELLVPGEIEAEAAAGFPSYAAGGERRYRTRQPAFSGFLRRGVTGAMTAAGAIQGNGTRVTGGGGAVWATGAGTLRSDAAGSRTAGGRWGHAIRFAFEREDPRPSNVSHRAWAVSTEYRSERFVTLGAAGTTQSVAWRHGVQYSQSIPWALSFAIGGAVQTGRGARRDSGSLSFFLGRDLFAGASAGLRLRHELDSAGARHSSAFLSVSVGLPGSGRQFATADRDTATATTTLDWRRIPDRAVGDVAAFVGTTRSPAERSIEADFSHTGARGQIGFSASATDPRAPAVGNQRAAGVRLGTAFVYADGAFGIGAPVRDAFAVVTAHPALAGHAIRINPDGDESWDAEINRLGPAVVPGLVPYRVQRLAFDGRTLPVGHSLGAGEAWVAPGYKAGTRVEVGTAATVLLTAVILDDDGAPVALAAGRIERPGDATFAPLLTFTNRNGRLTLEGLSAGVFELHLTSHPGQPARIEIPAEAEGIFDAGTVRLPPAAGAAP